MNDEEHSMSNSIADRWGLVVAEGGYGSGWTAIPSALIRNIGRLKLNGTDFAVLSVILSYWWKLDRMPTPTTGGIAAKLSLNKRSVERSIQKMIKLGLLARGSRPTDGRGSAKSFDLTPLRVLVEDLAIEDMWYIAEVRKRRKARTGRDPVARLEDFDALTD